MVTHKWQEREGEGEGGGERERCQDPGLGHGADGSAGPAARAAGHRLGHWPGRTMAKHLPVSVLYFILFVEN